MDNRYFDGIRRANQTRSIPAFGLIGGAKQPSTQALTEALKSPTVEFSIMSKDYDGMEAAYHALPKRLANMMLGSGMAMGSGMRDHGFECKTEADMQAIVHIYKRTLGKTPMKVVKHSAESVESDASAAVTEETRVLHDQSIRQGIKNLGDAVKLLGMDYDKMVVAFKSGDDANAQEWKKSVIQYIESVKIHLDSLNGHMRALSLQTVDGKTPRTSTGFAVNPMQPSAPKKSTVPNHPVRVGDVWVASYDTNEETFYNFYVVTKVTASGAYFANIEKLSASGGTSEFHSRSAPDPQKTPIGEPKLSVIKSHGDMRIGKGLSATINGRYAYPWDGKPVDEFTAYRKRWGMK